MNIIIFTCVSGIFFQRSIGAYQLAHFLRANGYTVQVIDFTDHFSADELLDLIKKFVNHETLAVGISTTFYSANSDNKKYINNDESKYDFLDFPQNLVSVVNYVKTNYNNVKVVIGGAKSETGKTIPNIDAVIHGYAEDKFLDYLNSLPNNKNKTSKSLIKIYKESNDNFLEIKNDPFEKQFSIENLDHRFSKNDLILPGETLPIEISRGCIFKCSFCAFPLNGKSKLDYIRDPELIKAELIYNYENFGTTNYFLSDDTFNDSTEKVEKIHKAITSLPFKINFTTYLRLDLLHAHKEQIPMLKEMGLTSPFFGIESFNQRSASTIGKGMNVEKAKDFLLELYYDHWGKQIPITCSFIVGLPYETLETINQTYEWARTNPINSMFFPLALTNKTSYKSDFNKNYQQYGYTLDLDTGYWENENFNYTQASIISEQYNSELLRKENYPSSWFLMTLLNHGYSIEQAKNTKIKDLSYSKIIRNQRRNIKEYKEQLQGLNIE